MGQAIVDLPDPLEPPQVSAASTDDLLAQLAGEEIERLLAEDESAGAARRALAENPSPSRAAPAQNRATDQSDGDLSAQLDELLNQSAGGAAAVFTPAPSSPANPPEEPHTDAAVSDEPHTSSSERTLLAAPPPAHAAMPGDRSGEPRPIELLLLRPLALLNAPLSSCPDYVRDAIGKAAIVTAVNAVAVLLYVLFFRRH